MELEAKYLIDSPERAGDIVALLKTLGYEIKPAASKSIEDHYFDTAHWRLARQGWAFRIRKLAEDSVLTLKSLGRSDQALHEREEFEQTISETPDDLRKLPAGLVQEKLHEWIGRKRLIERFRIENQRQLHLAHSDSGAAKLEIATDRASIRSDDGTLEFDELEIELLEGTRETLEEITAAISLELQLHPARQSKFERGLALIGARPQRVSGDALDTEQPLAEFASGVLEQRFGDLLLEEPRAWEGLHPEGVHQVRIATRRLRAALRVFRDVLPEDSAREFRSEFRWLASAFGEVRDLDVYRQNLDAYAAELGREQGAGLDIYRDELAAQWSSARSALLAALASARYRKLVDHFAKFLEEGPTQEALAAGGGASLKKAARRRVRKGVEKFLKHSRAISDTSPDEELHLLRIRGKKLRYLLEIFRRVPDIQISGALRALKKLQGVLGEHQDACVATGRLQDFAESLPTTKGSRETIFALGRLAERQRTIIGRSRAALGRVLAAFNKKAKKLR